MIITPPMWYIYLDTSITELKYNLNGNLKYTKIYKMKLITAYLLLFITK